MSMMWGIMPIRIPKFDDTKHLIVTSENLLVERKLIRQNDVVVIVIGVAFTTGSTNLIKIHRVGKDD